MFFMPAEVRRDIENTKCGIRLYAENIIYPDTVVPIVPSPQIYSKMDRENDLVSNIKLYHHIKQFQGGIHVMVAPEIQMYKLPLRQATLPTYIG